MQPPGTPELELHDIKGLDAISIWPLAPGWWIIIGVVLFGLGLAIWYYRKQLAFKYSWRSNALASLEQLQTNITADNAHDCLTELSEILRRVAIQRFSRQECAGLQGTQWLEWLSTHDPQQFNWRVKGKILIDAPYAPKGSQVGIHDVTTLANATRQWILREKK